MRKRSRTSKEKVIGNGPALNSNSSSSVSTSSISVNNSRENPDFLNSSSNSNGPQPMIIETRKAPKPKPKLRDEIGIALVCQSNVNRSMEAHAMLQKKGYKVRSFGAGSKVRLPGESVHKPNIYSFGTPYEEIYQDLKKKNQARYTKNGMLSMLDRNRKLKLKPERWQDEKSHFDVVITYERRVYESLLSDVEDRGGGEFRPAHLINLDTTDSHQEAQAGAHLTLQLIERIYKAEDWEDEIIEILDEFERRNHKGVLHTVIFY